jgi:hypothetical protein
LVDEVTDSIDEPLQHVQSEERAVARLGTHGEGVIELVWEESLPYFAVSHGDQE